MGPTDPRRASFQDRIAGAAEPFLDELASKVAAIQRPISGNVAVSPAERRARWWQQAKGWTPEHEQQLLTGTGADGMPMLDASGQPKRPLSAEDVGLLKYPHREVDALAFSGGDESKAARYARDMSAAGPPAPEYPSALPTTTPTYPAAGAPGGGDPAAFDADPAPAAGGVTAAPADALMPQQQGGPEPWRT